jgi:hypothetical protein
MATQTNNTQQIMKQKQSLQLSSLFMMIVTSMLFAYSSYGQVKYGDNLGNHTATTTLDLNNNNIKGIGSILYRKTTLNLTSGGAIGSAAATVDMYSVFAVTISSSGLALTLPAPTDATAGHVVKVLNTGATNSFTMYGLTIGVGQQAQFIYSGTAWLPSVSLATNIPFNGLTAATGTNTIDNTNFTQAWGWSTATTGTQLALSANALTTGKLLGISGGASPLTTGNLLYVSGAVSSSTTGAGSGLINIANTSASSTGTVATIQSNSTAGSGLTVLANGNVGIGTAAPKATLHNNGSTIIGASVTSNTDAPTGGNIGGLTAAASVDIASVFTVKQTTVNQALTLPAPTNTDAGRIATVIGGSGTVAFTMYGAAVSSGTTLSLIWDGTAWRTSAPSAVTVFNKSDILIPATTSSSLANTANGGSVNTSKVIALTVPGVSAGDAVTVNFTASDYTALGWLNPGVNDGIVILSSVASASNTVNVTLANLAAGTTPSIDALHLTVTYQH